MAIQTRDDGRQTVVINLGKKVPVKKITIKVEVVDDQPVVVEQIKFVQDIVPDNPAAEDVTVKNLTAKAGTKEVTLSWEAFPNITGYKIYYGTSANALTNTVETDQTTYTVGSLETSRPIILLWHRFPTTVARTGKAASRTWSVPHRSQTAYRTNRTTSL